MNEMIERVAKALVLKRIQSVRRFDPIERSEDFIQSAVEASYREWLEYAIAVIEAMKEPTEEMLNHISYTKDEYESEFIKHNYIELIKAALK